jgi:pyruvate carboxylase
VDGAMDSMSGLTSQPNLGSIVEALRHGPRDSGIDGDKLRALSSYWEQVRHLYGAFESDLRSGASEVYAHGMPGGQFTNLREQARSLGIDDVRWPEVARAYAQVNEMFGDIVKVTPTSKVVGDMALMMVTSGLSAAQVQDPATEIAFPESVVSLFRGELGQPYGGFPPALQQRILQGSDALTVRPGEVLPPIDLQQVRAQIDAKGWRAVTDEEFASYLMYPKVFLDYLNNRLEYGQVSVLPTSQFFYGMEPGDEVSIDIERGKTLIVRLVAASEGQDDGMRTVFFELNGQPRSVKIRDRSAVAVKPPRRKAEMSNGNHVAAPMPGTVATVNVVPGAKVARCDVLVTIEAMKIETSVRSDRAGTVAEVVATPGESIDAKDLLVVLTPPS